MSSAALLCKIRERILDGDTMRIKILSNSMAPTLVTGSRVIIERVAPEELKIGDIIAVISDDKIIVHRIIAIHGNNFFTKGDNVTSIDNTNCSIDMIIGRVIHSKSPRSLFKPLLSLVRELLLYLILLVRNFPIAIRCWSILLDLIKSSVKKHFKQKQVLHVHFHSRYIHNKVIPGSSDVDATLILSSHPSPLIRAYLRQKYLADGVALSRNLILFDPPYVLFEDEVPEILATSLYMRRSLVSDDVISTTILDVVNETNQFYKITGYLDELLSLVWRLQKMTSTHYKLPLLKNLKRSIELPKINTDITMLKHLIESGSETGLPAQVLSRDDVHTDYGDKDAEAILKQLTNKLVAQLGISEGLQDAEPQNLDSIAKFIIETLSSIAKDRMPETLNFGQFFKA